MPTHAPTDAPPDAAPDEPTGSPRPDVPPADLAAAAGRLVEAFATGDLDAYFGSFAPDTTFVFHTTDRVLTSVEQYRALWREWQAAGGFAVQECTTSEQRWHCWGDAAVLVHRVATTVLAGGAEERSDERETIVFERRDGRWLAVHEHLSLHPGTPPSEG